MRRASAGDLRERVTFQSRAEMDDGYGNPVSGPWTDRFTTRARLQPKLGSEAVVASRLQGIQPFMLTVRSNNDTRRVTPAWRAIHGGLAYDIKTAANIDERNVFIEMLVVQGGAT